MTVLCALSITIAVFVILDMDEPYGDCSGAEHRDAQRARRYDAPRRLKRKNGNVNAATGIGLNSGLGGASLLMTKREAMQ